YFAMKYLLDRGYRIIPVNPAAAGQEIMGQKVYASLDELPVKADMVDIFRNSEAAGPITDEAIRHGAKGVWMQLAVRNEEAGGRPEGGDEPLPQDRAQPPDRLDRMARHRQRCDLEQEARTIASSRRATCPCLWCARRCPRHLRPAARCCRGASGLCLRSRRPPPARRHRGRWLSPAARDGAGRSPAPGGQA